MNLQLKLYNIKQFNTQALQLLDCKACLVLTRNINLQYFLNSIHTGDIIFYLDNDLFTSFCITEQVLKDRHIRLPESRFIIIDDWYVLV